MDEMSEAVFGEREINWEDQLIAIDSGLLETENNWEFCKQDCQVGRGGYLGNGEDNSRGFKNS